MIVDKTNFDEVADACIAHIKEADYIAFDLEMSGIKTDENRSQIDLPNEFYHKSKVASSKYGIIQVGISCFKNSESGLVAYPYNFFIFPRPFQGKFNRDVTINSDCITFHEEIGTDMQRWIYKGINYFQFFTYEQVEKMALVPDAEEITEDVHSENLTNLNEKERNSFEEHKKRYEEFATGKEDEIEFIESKGGVRKCMYGLINTTTPDFYYRTEEIAPGKWDKRITVFRTTKEEQTAKKTEFEEKKKADFHQVLGFTRIWRELISFKKPVIGHNCFFDLLFLFEHLHRNNAYSFSKFKKTVNSCWPQLYDTKILSNEIKRDDVSSKMNLEDLYKKLQEITQIKISCGEGFDDYSNPTEAKPDSYHSAGFDAFVTGACYYMLSKLEGADEVFQQFKNKIRMGTSRLFMADFEEEDKDTVIADKMHIIVLTEKSKDIDRSDQHKIQNLILDSVPEEARKSAISTMQFSPNGLYIKQNFLAYFFGFDKKFQTEFLSMKNSITAALKKDKVDHVGVFNLKEYSDHLMDIVKAKEETMGQKGGGNKGGKGFKDKK